MKKIINNIMPEWLSYIIGKFRTSGFAKFFYFRENELIKYSQDNYSKIIERIKIKNKIKVAFFVVQPSIWKYDNLYKLMEKDDKFEPVIIACSSIIAGKEIMMQNMEILYHQFKEKNYNVVKAYNPASDKWLSVKNDIQPDIIFYTLPYNDYTIDEYHITNNLNCLNCYVQYSFIITTFYHTCYDMLFYNLLWIAFYETPIHYKIAQMHARNKAQNVVVTGFPGTDIFLDKQYKPNDVWKIKDRKIKRIIWAPHHTFDGSKSQIGTSNFIKYHQFMIDVAKKYKDKIQISFKPHPLLKPKLYKNKHWGQVKTDEYYNKWNALPNGQLNEHEYIDLFLTSDALIHDCGSFMVEYIFVNKPVMYTVKAKNHIKNKLNIFGKLVFKQLYKGYSKEDIENFIENVINNIDPMYENRKIFLNKYLIPPKTGNASLNIINELKRRLLK